MSIISANRINTLKAAVKAECQRRTYSTGSVAAYGGAAYDYTAVPASGKTILKEHYEKLAVPMHAINATSTPGTSGARIISEAEIAAMETKVASYKNRNYYDTTGDCSASCSGLCFSCSSCTNCTSCTSCSGCGGCDGSCVGSCGGCGDCTGCAGCSGCGSGCSFSCTGLVT